MHISTEFGVFLALRARNVGFSFLLKICSPQALAKSGCAFPPCKGGHCFQRAAGGFPGNSVIPRGVCIVKVSDFHGPSRARKSALQAAPPGTLLDSIGIT